MPKKKKAEATPDVEVRSVDLNEVRRLLDFMAQHGLKEFEYESKDFHVRLKKASPQEESFRTSPASVSTPAQHEPSSAGSTPSQVAGATRAPATEPVVADDIHVVKSPIVGTFYAAPSPGSDPFVKIGANVDEGTVLGIIEAMKLMNEIESDVAGEVVKVFIENGSPVEYGEPLFGIRASQKKK
jgi:acetyl-CoA carboxylase biotin carboxyl carrier protein